MASGILQEAIVKIKEVGVENARVSPIPNSKKARVEVKENGVWIAVIPEIDMKLAEDVLRQAKSKLIFG